jgi:hypothetical protein
VLNSATGFLTVARSHVGRLRRRQEIERYSEH